MWFSLRISRVSGTLSVLLSHSQLADTSNSSLKKEVWRNYIHIENSIKPYSLHILTYHITLRSSKYTYLMKLSYQNKVIKNYAFHVSTLYWGSISKLQVMPMETFQLPILNHKFNHFAGHTRHGMDLQLSTSKYSAKHNHIINPFVSSYL